MPAPNGNTLEMADEVVADPHRTYFHAVLHPNRSLNRTGFLVLMGVLLAFNGFLGVLFLVAGAWPIAGFMGADVLLVYLAFRINYRSGRLYEEVRLTDTDLTVVRVWPSRSRRQWQFEPYWLRVHMDDPPRHESQLRLVSHGETLVIGAFLSPDERADLAQALRAALARWREPNHLRPLAPA